MAIRYCGTITIRLRIEGEGYRVNLSVRDGLTRVTYTVHVGMPRIATYATDSSAAFDSAAKAAISFSPSEIQEHADTTNMDWFVRRTLVYPAAMRAANHTHTAFRRNARTVHDTGARAETTVYVPMATHLRNDGGCAGFVHFGCKGSPLPW